MVIIFVGNSYCFLQLRKGELTINFVKRLDKPLIIGFILAHILLFFTFQEKNIFWYIFTASMLFLIGFSILNEEIDDHLSFIKYLFLGILSGSLLYGIFYIGNILLSELNLPFAKEVTKLYKQLSPTTIWHHIVLILIIIPGEEIFWRGFIQKRLAKILPIHISILIASLMYASVNIYSNTYILPFVAILTGIYWGYLYHWKKSLPLVIVSHLIFDFLLLVLFPLR